MEVVTLPTSSSSSSATYYLRRALFQSSHHRGNPPRQLFFSNGVSSSKKFSNEGKDRRSLVVAGAKKRKSKTDSHSFIPKPDETTGPFPEAVLLKKKTVREDGRVLPEFADADEEKLYEFLSLQLESDLNVERVSRRNAIASLLSTSLFTQLASSFDVALAEPSIGFREHIDLFDGYTFIYPKNWIQVRGAGADIFFRDPFVLDENLSVELSSPSSSRYTSVEDLGPPQVAAEKVLKQYLTEFMSTRLGVRRESNILSTSSRVADDERVYYQVEVNIKSYANNNEMAVMPQDRVPRLEWDRRYLSVLGVGNNRLYELRLQIPESVFLGEEKDLKKVMDSFRVLKAVD